MNKIHQYKLSFYGINFNIIYNYIIIELDLMESLILKIEIYLGN